MCNRYASNLRKLPASVKAKLGIVEEIDDRRIDIFPDRLAPIIRKGGGDSWCLESYRWGFPSPKPSGQHVTNVRNLESNYWRAWLKPEYRCLVPFAAFSEYDDASPVGKKVLRWFEIASSEENPVAFFAGIWRHWTGARGTKANPDIGEHMLFSFLTCPANDVVRPIHEKAMPVVLATLQECEDWLDAPMEAVLAMQRPLANEKLRLLLT